jgi:hypothetical protein
LEEGALLQKTDNEAEDLKEAAIKEAETAMNRRISEANNGEAEVDF